MGNHLLQPHPPLHSNRYRCLQWLECPWVGKAALSCGFSEALTLLGVAITAQDDTVRRCFPLFYGLPVIVNPETKENWAGIVARDANLKDILMQQKLFARCLQYQWHPLIKSSGINN